ncbi:MAG: transporter substrate-binding domain-containing protein [Arenicellales bacterium]
MTRNYLNLKSVFFVLLVLLLAAAGSERTAYATESDSVIAKLVAESTLTKATKAKSLRVGWASWFPFMYRDPKSDKLTGFTVDLYENYLGPAMGVKVVWVEQPWSTMLAGLQADRFDVVANANRTSKRLLAADYAGPITQTGKALLARQDGVTKYHDWQDADNPNTKICVALGTSADTEVTEYFKHADIMRVEGDPACIAALAGKRADIYATDIGNLVALEQAHPEFKIVPNSTFTKTELGVYVKQGDVVMLNWMNQFIRQVKLSGAIDELIKKYDLKGVKVAW